MKIVWTDDALDDFEDVLAYYYLKAGPRTAEAVERRIVGQVKALIPFPESIRESERIPGTRELVIDKLPYIVFVRITKGKIVVLNVVNTARKFPR
jgi:toxin ParE1/3/4